MNPVRSHLIEKNRDIYLNCESKKGLDFVSFNSYPIDMHNKLKKYYQNFSEILNQDGLLDRISALNRKIKNPLKCAYSCIEENIGYKRMIIKWLDYINPEIEDADIEKMTNFILNNWLNPHFYPFLSNILVETILTKIPKDQVICRLSSTIPGCISFSYFRNGEIKHCRFSYNPKSDTLTPYLGKTHYKSLYEIIDKLKTSIAN